MSYETILTEDVDGVRVISMNRPERLNAWTPYMGGEIRQAVEGANEDDSLVGLTVEQVCGKTPHKQVNIAVLVEVSPTGNAS